ncbi:membrane protein [Streptomyces albiaxialis]|uniref:Membrane protein n=1 Tax=Streptomyces albiaxialis TaxID=329523 RepID=A0ABN2VMK0_9ACTN
MHMNSAPHLLREDRPEFERVLDEALRTAHRRPDLAALGQRLNAEQLRTMALSAATAIAACAEAEYQQFVRLREELRQPANAPSSMGPPERERGPDGVEPRGEGVSRLASAMGGEGLAEATGAGLVAVVSVLAPVLAGTAAVIFLLLGYALHLMTPEPSIAQPMRSAGWVFAALAAAGIVIAMGGLLLAALRNGASSVRAPGGGKGERGRGADHGAGGLSEEVALARAAWREALLERGIVPFLREALADPQGAEQAPATYVQREQRTTFGYTHPDFSSRPASESPDEPGPRLRFTSPDYSSPDYGGPEHPKP